MRTISLAILFVVCAFTSAAQAKVPATDAKIAVPKHFDFDDDLVEAGLDHALDGPLNAAPHRRRDSLIRVRQSFVPEMLRSCDGV
jgi:hypothetical protein